MSFLYISLASSACYSDGKLESKLFFFLSLKLPSSLSGDFIVVLTNTILISLLRFD